MQSSGHKEITHLTILNAVRNILILRSEYRQFLWETLEQKALSLINPIPCGGVRSDPPPVFELWQKNYLFDWIEIFWQFLNNHFTHFIFYKIFSRASLSPTFWVPQRIPCGGGVRSDPPSQIVSFHRRKVQFTFFPHKIKFPATFI